MSNNVHTQITRLTDRQSPHRPPTRWATTLLPTRPNAGAVSLPPSRSPLKATDAQAGSHHGYASLDPALPLRTHTTLDSNTTLGHTTTLLAGTPISTLLLMLVRRFMLDRQPQLGRAGARSSRRCGTLGKAGTVGMFRGDRSGLAVFRSGGSRRHEGGFSSIPFG